MGKNCFNYLDMYLKREYSSIMNHLLTYLILGNIYTIRSNYRYYIPDTDYVLEMHDWLNDP